jgi:hypothetical protein
MITSGSSLVSSPFKHLSAPQTPCVTTVGTIMTEYVRRESFLRWADLDFQSHTHQMAVNDMLILPGGLTIIDFAFP